MKELGQYLIDEQQRIEQALLHCLKRLTGPAQLGEAMQYSLMAGGKRIRPILLLATIDALGKDSEIGLFPGCALEMMHTYSLIHDDLPAMDNDDFRRGKPTNHKVFGDALAILAGDALLTHSFSIIANETSSALPDSLKVQLIAELAKRGGAEGMVGGQVADMIAEEKPSSLTELVYIHRHKTADLLICSVRFGALIGGAAPDQLDCLSRYAEHLGLAFQIQDDILDEIGDEQKLGKQVGSDRGNEKSTYVSFLGLDTARMELERHIGIAKEALHAADISAERLLQLADYMLHREQ